MTAEDVLNDENYQYSMNIGQGGTRYAPYSVKVINALARAMGRLEHATEWAGVDHDMPGTTQREREASRWAAIQLLHELHHELTSWSQYKEDNGRAPRVETPSSKKQAGMLIAGPFRNVKETLSEDEREQYGDYRFMVATDRLMEVLAAEVYDTRLYEPRYMTDAELEEAYTDRREEEHFYNY